MDKDKTSKDHSRAYIMEMAIGNLADAIATHERCIRNLSGITPEDEKSPGPSNEPANEPAIIPLLHELPAILDGLAERISDTTAILEEHLL